MIPTIMCIKSESGKERYAGY